MHHHSQMLSVPPPAAEPSPLPLIMKKRLKRNHIVIRKVGSILLLGVSIFTLTSSIHRVRCFATTRDHQFHIQRIPRKRERLHHHDVGTTTNRFNHDNNNDSNIILNNNRLPTSTSSSSRRGAGYGILTQMNRSLPSSHHRVGSWDNNKRQNSVADWSVLRVIGGAQDEDDVFQQPPQRDDDGKKLLPGRWPCFDEMDKDLIKFSLPVIGNYAINPLIGAVDLFWVNRMGNALAVAGQSAANQVFSSAFWFVSFLPSVTATLVSKQHAKGDPEATQDAICQALFVGFFIALIGTPAMYFFPDQALGAVLAHGAPAMEYAKPYLLIRAFAFLPSLVSLVGFSAFRGILDTQTPVKISAFANIFNAVLDPILIFAFAMGVPGAAMATLAAEIISAAIYIGLLRKKNLILWKKLIRPPSWKSLEPLLKGGLALQLRNFSLNLTFLAVARVTQSIDRSGVAAAAHAMAIQTFQIGGIVLLALSTVAQTIVPNAMVERIDKKTNSKVGGLEYANATVNRLMSWGFILGCALGSLQVLLLPVIRRATPLQEVRDAATIPAMIGSLLQVINGLVFIGEGVMIGTGSFLQLSISTLVATIGCLWALWFFPPRVGLTGVWLGFGVFNTIRLAGVYIHQRMNGPLSPRKIAEAMAKN
jgi:MATE family multidrug resistance protein